MEVLEDVGVVAVKDLDVEVVAEGDLDAVEGDLDAVEGEPDAVEGDLGAVEGDLDVVEGDPDAVEGDLDVVEGESVARFFQEAVVAVMAVVVLWGVDMEEMMWVDLDQN